MKIFLIAIFLFGFQSIGICADKIQNFPTDCTTAKDKIEFGYIAQETLREKHNEMGRKYRDGLIDQAEWNTFTDDFFKRNMRVSHTINEQKELLKKSKKWLVDLDSI